MAGREANLMLERRTFLAQAGATPILAVALAAHATGARNLIVRYDRLFLDVRLNGHPVRALMDSAADTSLVDTLFARKIGLTGGETVEARGSGGDTQADMAGGVKIEALGLQLGPLTVAVLDLSDVGRRLLHGPLDLILGRELFDAARLSINIAEGRMGIARPSVDPAGVLFDLRTEKGIETFAASVEGHGDVQAAFDLGNGGAVLVGADYAKEIGLLSDGRAISVVSGGGIGGARPRQTLRLRSLSVAGRVFENVPAAIDATGSATKLNIGVPVLRHFQIVTDFAAHKLWLKSGPT
jgi:Aspartyl protease